MSDGRIVIDVILDDGSVARGVGNINNQLGGLNEGGQRASLGIGKIVTALGLVAVASKAIDMVKSSLDGAISRYDTLNAFPRVMQQMGFDAKESSGAIERLSAGIDGLPTTLDSVASKAQRIAVMTGDLDGAVETTLALNNAFLASGASSSDAERGLEQYVQMLAKGEVDLQSWRTLQETMGLSLNETAKAFGFTGKSAQIDLYEALKSGSITFDEFNGKIVELSNKTGGFADIARESSGGIKTSWTNMKTSIVKGVADVIGAIDEALGGVGSIEGLLDKAKEGIKTAFKAIVQAIPEVVERIKEVYDTLKPWLPLIGSVAVAFGAVFTSIATLNSARAIIDAIKKSQLALNVVASLNPWGLVAMAVIAAVALIYIYWDPIKEFFINLWESIKEIGLAIWDNLKEKWATTVEELKALWATVSEFFTDLWEGIKSVSSAVWNAIVSVVMAIVTPFINGVMNIFNNMKDGLQTLWDGLKQYFKGVWDLIKNIFLGAVLLIINLVTGNFDELKANSIAIFENIKEALRNIWEGIKKIFSGALQAIWGFVKSAWENVKNNTISIFNETKTIIINIWDGIKSFFAEILPRLLELVRQKFSDIVRAVMEKMIETKQKITDIWNQVENFLKSINLFEIGKDIMQGLLDGIKSMASAIWDTVKNIADGLKNSIRDALSIHSPSRWMRDVIGKNMMLGWMEGIDGEKMATIRKASEAAEWMKPDLPVVNRLRGAMPYLGNIAAVAGANSGVTTNSIKHGNTINIKNSNTFTPAESTPSEVARKQKQQMQRLAMEWR